NGRAFLVRRSKSFPPIAGCHIVFISASEKSRVRTILDHLQGSSALTVSDMPGFCENGGMIDLGTLETKVRIEINPEAAERARLKVSSKLLGVARIVRQGSR